MAELLARHGAHPMFETSAPEVSEAGEEVYSYRIPSSYDMAAIEGLRDRLVAGAARRAAMMRDLLVREPWDLFLGVFSETHTASHLLWHVSQRHPLHDTLMQGRNDDPLLEVFQTVDRALAEVLDAAPDDADVVLFSIYGIAENVLDLPSMAFLPELLYRWSFPGQQMLGGAVDIAPGRDYPAHWKDEVWRLRTARGDAELESPDRQAQRGDPMHWQPANWYRPLWPRMRAFALPTYSEGLIRINVQGRERDGQVAPGDYQRTCDEICDYLSAVRDARSGKPMVKEIVRVRQDPLDDDGFGPPADLIVLWQEDTATDLIESPSAGRIGPLPYFRTGGHCSQGFLAARGPRIQPGSRLSDLQATDLTATLLSLLGQAVPDYVDGRAVL
jgi:predicted AlkP superfamily phosphohydrolase/phosphomutase